jgi:hypothetical protein
VTEEDPVKADLAGAASRLQRFNTTATKEIVGQVPALSFADEKRTKERVIRFVVERVSLWRKLYNGVELGNGETVRYSLEDSARLVGISKKSLDDYLLQLRFGRMYGFDFLKHQCDNIGVLRKFVRDHKNKQKRQRERKTKDDVSSEMITEEDVTHRIAAPEIDQCMVDESSVKKQESDSDAK